MKNTYFLSDTHFSHKRVILYSNRSFTDIDQMNEAMIKNWNDNVKEGDDIYHLGDVSFASYRETKNILRRLKGNIHIILGNHDKVIIDNMNGFLHEGLVKSIDSYKELSILDCPKIVLFHFGMRTWNKAHYGSIHCYGHSHGNLPPFGKSVDVGVDCKEITPEYRPIHLDELLEYMKSREFVSVDHHMRKD